MRLQTLFEHTAELIRIAYSSPQPTDNFLSDIFRKRKNYGSKERKFISNTVYFYFRNKFLIDFLSSRLTTKHKFDNKYLPQVLTAIIISRLFPNEFPDYSPIDILTKLEKNFVYDELLVNDFGIEYNSFTNNIIENFVSLNNEINKLSERELNENEFELIETRYSMPKFIITKILSNFKNTNELIKFLDNSTRQAPITIRINNLRTNADYIVEQFNKMNIAAIPSSLVPSAIKINQRVQFSELNDYKNGFFEIQDEGSQLISLFLNPDYTDRILDACAGAGGKSLHIATLQNDQGEIIANDTEFARLKELPKRANRCGLSSIKINLTVWNTKHSILQPNSFDKVLVDAPCSGLGTLRRNPLKKFKITQKILDKLTINQISILKYYSNFVSIGGELIYSTCSILNEENTDIARKFIENNSNFEPMDISNIVNKYNLQSKLRLIGTNFISIDFGSSDADGFFMAKFRRIS